jgi:hypothetical protein
MCFVLSGLIMGVLLAGSFAVSAALFVVLLVGGSVGFYLSRGRKKRLLAIAQRSRAPAGASASGSLSPHKSVESAPGSCE